MTDEKISKQARAEALKIARGIQRPGQKKEQTKLIAKGIEKGIPNALCTLITCPIKLSNEEKSCFQNN